MTGDQFEKISDIQQKYYVSLNGSHHLTTSQFKKIATILGGRYEDLSKHQKKTFRAVMLDSYKTWDWFLSV